MPNSRPSSSGARSDSPESTERRETFRRSDPAARSGPPVAPEERLAEFHAVLEEIDTIFGLLRVEIDQARPSPELPERPTPAAAPRLAAPPPVAESPVVEEETSWGAPSPFLDDRLATAREVAAGISTEFDTIRRQTQGLGEAVETLRSELDRASEELAFLRGNEGADAPVAPTRPLAELRVARAAPAAASAWEGSRPVAEAPAYDSFTVARYNETVQDLQGRRRRLGTTMLVLAAVISAVLMAIEFLAHEPAPVWWLAGLPIIWMVPVPFFVSSFVGTHRLLSEVPLDLPEAG
jgi:hypothetical protein